MKKIGMYIKKIGTHMEKIKIFKRGTGMYTCSSRAHKGEYFIMGPYTGKILVKTPWFNVLERDTEGVSL